MAEQGEAIRHMLVTAEGIKEESEYEDRNIPKDNCVMVTTVHKNFEGYTKHNVKKAPEARRLQGIVHLRTVRISTKLVAPISLTPLLETCLPCYSSLK